MSEALGREFGLRNWVRDVERLGELQVIEGAHWDCEIGGLTELISEAHVEPPALMFDAIPGYPKGYRVMTNQIDTASRLALTIGLDPGLRPLEFVDTWRQQQRQREGVPPKEVPIEDHFDHVDLGDDVDLLKFPTPLWHEQDGGRYIGTADLVIIGDPDDSGFDHVNVGTYRVMVHDERTMASFISPGKHGRVLRDRHFAQGKNCPIVIVVGQDPLLFVASSSDVPAGQSELEYTGGILGAPVPVVKGPTTGLPIPADAEIAIEGEILFDTDMDEGPFGEWTGYYASGVRREPIIRVNAVLYKDEPIMCGAPPMVPSSGKGNIRNSLIRSAHIWNALEAAGVPGVKGVWMPAPAGRFMTVVAIEQKYAGHARQAASIAGQCRQGAYLGRYVVVVDDDIDIVNFDDVLWAICTRTDPSEDIDFLRRAWSGPLDPAIPPHRTGLNSRAYIDATRPYEWREQFPKVSGISRELRGEILAKWEPKGVL